VTTFIDFRYSRALAAALFAGQEKEEGDIVIRPDRDSYFVLEVDTASQTHIANLRRRDGSVAARIGICDGATVYFTREDSSESIMAKLDASGNGRSLIGVRIGPRCSGLRIGDARFAVEHDGDKPMDDSDTQLTLHCAPGVRVMGRGTGRVHRWGELFFNREKAPGLCVELTMDWHHLRAGIPLFGTMTAEHLLEQGKFRLRFRSYAYEADDAEATDFVKLFASDDRADIAVHLSPALYDARAMDIPNLAFGVVEAENVQRHIVDRYNLMDAVLVPSQFAARAFKRSGVTRPIHVVSHGVDTEFFAPPEVRTQLPGGRKFNFLAIGTHVERKNFMHLVRAFLEEFRESDDVALFLLLRPEYHTTQNNVALEFTEWERKWARPDSAPIFLWTGYLTREHLRDFYAHADAYVMPSNEGFGLTLLEAMSSGTPVIGLNHGGVRDFLNEKTGYPVNISRAYKASDIDTLPYVGDRFYKPDVKHLRSVMRHVASHPEEARARATYGRSLCESKMTWDRVTRTF
jgi:glycosyltransferase involved in cell wall biosynthesis